MNHYQVVAHAAPLALFCVAESDGERLRDNNIVAVHTSTPRQLLGAHFIIFGTLHASGWLAYCLFRTVSCGKR